MALERSIEKFEDDLNLIIERLCNSEDKRICRHIIRLRNKLLNLYRRNIVKINHSIMEIICAKHLISYGYYVDLEYALDSNLTCDIYALKGLGSLIVEVETGYVPPEHAIDPLTYCKARIASKITRYSGYAEKFALAAPPYYIFWIPPALVKPPRHRTMREIKEIKTLCDLYYSNPPVSMEEIKNARIHAVYILDVDGGIVRETDPNTYLERAQRIWGGEFFE